MERMRTFFLYALIIVGFFGISVLLENGLLLSMYSNIPGEVDGHYSAMHSNLSIKNASAKACNVNGYMNFDIENTTGSFIDKCYIKIDLYNEQNLLADTEYIEILEMQPEYKKTFNIKFKANNIERYSISIVKDVPDKTNIINILGWEIDLSNVFGLGIDLTNVSIFGVKLTDIFSVDNVKKAGSNAWSYIKLFLMGIPWWGYAIAGGIVMWYMPAFYLFGIL